VARWNRDRLAPDYVYPGGESRAGFNARVGLGVERMRAILRPGVTLLVAHRGVIRAITRVLTGAEPVIELGSIQLLAYNGTNQWAIEQLDCTAHLAEVG